MEDVATRKTQGGAHGITADGAIVVVLGELFRGQRLVDVGDVVRKLSVVLIGDEFGAQGDDDDDQTDDDENVEENVEGDSVEVKNSGVIDERDHEDDGFGEEVRVVGVGTAMFPSSVVMNSVDVVGSILDESADGNDKQREALGHNEEELVCGDLVARAHGKSEDCKVGHEEKAKESNDLAVYPPCSVGGISDECLEPVACEIAKQAHRSHEEEPCAPFHDNVQARIQDSAHSQEVEHQIVDEALPHFLLERQDKRAD